MLTSPYDHKYKAGNMSSWWGLTWISVRCRGKSKWTSSQVGSAQTQRRAQMRPPAPATPKHPCQVKTTPSDQQIDRQLASMPATVHDQSCAMCPASQPTFLSAFVIWSAQNNDRLFLGFCPCPLALSWHLFHLSCCILPTEERWHQLLPLQLMIGGRLSQVPVSVCRLSTLP